MLNMFNKYEKYRKYNNKDLYRLHVICGSIPHLKMMALKDLFELVLWAINCENISFIKEVTAVYRKKVQNIFGYTAYSYLLLIALYHKNNNIFNYMTNIKYININKLITYDIINRLKSGIHDTKRYDILLCNGEVFQVGYESMICMHYNHIRGRNCENTNIKHIVNNMNRDLNNVKQKVS